MNQSNITYVYHAQSGVQRLIFSALERVMQDLSYRTLIWAELRSKPQDKKFFKIFEGRQNLFKSVFAWRWPIFTWNVRSIKSGKISDFGTKPVNMGRVWLKNYLSHSQRQLQDLFHVWLHLIGNEIWRKYSTAYVN